jgi:hypothetical protein
MSDEMLTIGEIGIIPEYEFSGTHILETNQLILGKCDELRPYHNNLNSSQHMK